MLGDTFQRILKATGKRVEVQNYIDNTGVQVADVVVGFIYLENMDLAAIKALDAELTAAGKSFDYYCWDLYTKVGVEYQTNEELKEKRAEVLHLIEEGGNETAELGRLCRDPQRRMHSRHDGAAFDPLRPAAARIRDPASAFLGQGVRTDETARRDPLRNRGQPRRLLGDAVRRRIRGTTITKPTRSSSAQTAR